MFRCDALVAREAELEALEAALRRSWVGQGPACVVMGRAGVGKSALTAACLRMAPAGAALVGRALPATATPLRPLTELALGAVRAGADPDTEGLRLYGSTLTRLLHGGGGAVDAAEPGGMLALAAGEALLRLVRGLPPPVVLLLEDLHWADAETLDTFEYLADHAPAEQVAVIATLRDDEPGPAPGVVARIAARHGARVIQLRPLGREDVEEMVARCVGPDAAAQLVDEVVNRTEGVPLLVEEWLSSAADVGRLRRRGDRWGLAPGHVPVPASLASAVAGRLDALAGADRELLVTGALIGRDLQPDLLHSATGRDPAATAAALRAATGVGLVERAGPGEGLRFRHALTREAVLAAPLPHERVAIARAALDRLEATGASAPVVEAIAALAGEAEDPHRLARALLRAGEVATRRGALTTARARLEGCIAVARDIDDGLADDAALALLTVLSLSGEFEAARATGLELLLHLDVSRDSARTAAVHLAIARAAVNVQRFDEAAEHLERAGAGHDVATDALVALTALGQGRNADAEAAALRALAAAESAQPGAPAQAPVCEALEVLGRLARQRDLDEAERWFRRAATTAQKAGLPVWRARALHELATVRQLRHGEVDALRVARDAAVDAGALSLVVGIDFHLSAVLGVRFEVEQALASGRDALDLARRLGAPYLEAMAWIVIGQAHAAAAKRTEAEAAGREALRLAGGDPEVAGLVDGACRALASLLLDDVPAALDQLRAAIANLRRVDGKTPISPWYLWPLLATLHGEADEGAQARRETDTPELRVATGFDALWHLADAAAHGAGGGRERAERAHDLAEAAFAAAPGFAGYRALGHRLAAPAALRHGWGSPLAWLADAEVWFRDHALDAQARACRSLQRRAGVPQRRRGRGDAAVPQPLAAVGVTSREYDVLNLLAQGLPNAEIASRLYISLRTVKTHLEHVRTKTGAVSRVELAALARPAP